MLLYVCPYAVKRVCPHAHILFSTCLITCVLMLAGKENEDDEKDDEEDDGGDDEEDDGGGDDEVEVRPYA